MIQPNELRIGNLITTLAGPIKVEPWMLTPEINIVFEGIPLTNEWLERLGFTVEYTIGGWLKWQKGDFKLLDRKLPHDGPKEPVQFVHQLQNLYYAITGNELDMKP